MASKPAPSAYQHWQRILQRWPIDLVRPQSVSFQHVMQQRLDKLHPSSPSHQSTKETAPSIASTWNEKHELGQVNALYSLLENRYAKAYPMPPSLRHPRFRETYYDDVVKEMAQAPGRNWWDRLLLRWKGKVRFT